MDVESTIACIVVAASRAEIREHGIGCEEVKSPDAFMPSTGIVHHYDHRLDMMIMFTVDIHIFVVKFRVFQKCL